MSKKVLNHPDKDEIVKRLVEGQSVKKVEDFLSKKYPKKKRLHVSYMTLQKFRKEHLNIKGEVLEDIKNKRTEIISQEKKEDAKEQLLKTSAYRDKIQEIAETEIDVTRRLLEMEKLIASRMEYYFNLLSVGGSIKDDRVFLDYINTMRSLLQDWKKYIEGFKDVRVENNINVTIVNQQISIIKEVVCEVLGELEPQNVPVFIEKVDSKLNSINSNAYSDLVSRGDYE
jgi:hypothetical protein